MFKNSKIFERKFVKFGLKNISEFKEKSIKWADNNFQVFSLFENNNITYPKEPFQNIFAIGSLSKFCHTENDTFNALNHFHVNNKDWLFGFLTYDLKNEIEDLSSNNQDKINNLDSFFYVPEIIIKFTANEVHISSYLLDEEDVFYDIFMVSLTDELLILSESIIINQVETEESYIKSIEQIQNHILEGDVYELNYCTEFYAENVKINPVLLFKRLNQNSPMPFAALQKINDNYLVCASPERFLKKEGKKIISQPIKGTAKRGKNEAEDKVIIKQLKADEKEVAENMMIVDLVRNDLAKSAVSGTVKVSEIFEVYSFKYLHQMISTIEAEIKDGIKFSDVIRNAFPMGSMTGAPKIMAMKLIEKYEKTKRGLYSGTVGYITPEGDFDFNVVIRSVNYNAKNNYLSFQVGSAITFDSIPEKEYQECMLKAKAIINVLK